VPAYLAQTFQLSSLALLLTKLGGTIDTSNFGKTINTNNINIVTSEMSLIHNQLKYSAIAPGDVTHVYTGALWA